MSEETVSNLAAFVKGIEQTGFPFEFETVQMLLADNWTVISNKYYIDNENSTPREIDIVAYKVEITPRVTVATALIVSCKKSESGTWAFLTRAINTGDPNSNWTPLHTWTNNRALQYLSQQDSFAESYYRSVQLDAPDSVLQTPDYDVFAFQEMTEIDGAKKGASLDVAKVKGDSTIFASIITLMKAQAYELSAREDKAARRKSKKPLLYQFNLVGACDLDFVKLHFSSDPISPSRPDLISYVGRYMFNGKETFSRISFATKSALPKLIRRFSDLHKKNVSHFTAIENDFYDNWTEDYEKRRYLSRLFIDDLAKRITNASKDKEEAISVDLNSKTEPFIFISEKRDLATIWLYGVNEDQVAALNDDSRVAKLTKAALKEYFRHEGDFVFTEAPF